MNQEQLEMIARGLRDARPITTIDNQFMTARDKDALLVWSQCCIHIAANIAQAHPRFNQEAFLKDRCKVPGFYRAEARDDDSTTHAWTMADGTIQQLTDSQASLLQRRRHVVSTDPAPFNSTPVRKL